MKTKKTISLALALTSLASLAYWLGYQHGSSSTQGRLRTVSHVRQIGLGFRAGHNDIGRFNATGNLITLDPQTQKR